MKNIIIDTEMIKEIGDKLLRYGNIKVTDRRIIHDGAVVVGTLALMGVGVGKVELTDKILTVQGFWVADEDSVTGLTTGDFVQFSMPINALDYVTAKNKANLVVQMFNLGKANQETEKNEDNENNID